jgi:hypothetical protein
MGPERRLFVPRYRQTHGIPMGLTPITDNLCHLKITGILPQEAIFGILVNTLNSRTSPQMNILEKYYREPLKTWMPNVNTAAPLMMIDLPIRTVVMEMTDVKCQRNLIRRNGNGISAIGPRRVV